MSSSGFLSDPRVDGARRFLSRYSPFISVTIAILLIAILLPGRQVADTVDETATGIADTTTSDVPIEDAAPGNIASKGDIGAVDEGHAEGAVGAAGGRDQVRRSEEEGDRARHQLRPEDRAHQAPDTLRVPMHTEVRRAERRIDVAGSDGQGDRRRVLQRRGRRSVRGDPHGCRRQRQRRGDQGAGPRLDQPLSVRTPICGDGR